MMNERVFGFQITWRKHNNRKGLAFSLAIPREMFYWRKCFPKKYCLHRRPLYSCYLSQRSYHATGGPFSVLSKSKFLLSKPFLLGDYMRGDSPRGYSSL